MTESTPTEIPRLSPTAPPGAVIEALERAGAVILEGMLDVADVAAKKADLDRILASVPTGRNAFEGFETQRIYALFAKTRTFDAQAVDPTILAVTEEILGANSVLSAPTGIRIGPGETAQALHRDDAVYPIPRPHPELVLNTMWALDDFTEENGATRVAPGSHRRPDLEPPDVGETVAAEMPSGSVMIWLGSLIHGGGANRTQRPRLGVLLEYCAGWLRPQENHLLAVPRDVVSALPERLAELLGYGIHGKLLGYVDGRHPRKCLGGRVGGDSAERRETTPGIEINGIAHVQLSVADPAHTVPFWERLCHFLGMRTLITGDEVVYCIGGRTGVLVRGAPAEKREQRFDQDRAGLHHLCFRARSREDVDAVFRFARDQLDAEIVHPAEEGSQFAPGYYSVLFEDPDGIRIEVNHVPGRGHFGSGGRLGPGGEGPAGRYGADGLSS